MPETLFDQDSEMVEAPETPEVSFEDLVGDGKRYRDSAAVAKAVVEKDRFIEQLKSELREERGRVQSSMKMEEFLDKVSATIGKSPSEREPQVQQQEGLTEEKVNQFVEQKLNQYAARNRLQQNLDTVRAELQKEFGENYKVQLKQIANRLGETPEFMDALAAERPKVFMQLIKQAHASAPPVTPPQTSFRTPAGVTSGKRNAAYYEKMRKENPKLFESFAVQKQWFEDTERMGEAFFDD